MAVVFDAVGPGSGGNATTGTSASWSHTCSGSNRFLVVGVSIGASPDTGITTSVTYNGVAMSSVSTVHSNNDVAGYVQMFYLVAPATGSNTVLVTTSASADIISGSISFTGVDQTSPISSTVTNAGAGASGSVSVSGNSGDMVVDVLCCGAGFGTGGSGQMSRWLKNYNTSTAAGNAAQSTAFGGSSIPMSYTFNSDWWAIIAINISAVAIVASPIIPPTFIAAYNSTYGTASATKSVTVTTQTGDLLVVYGGADTGATSTPGILSTPVGNNIAFSLLQSLTTASNASAFIWWGIESSGRTNWTLSCGIDDATAIWGFTCVVFRGSAGIGASNKAQAFGVSTLSLTTLQANSAIVVFNADWAGQDGSGRVWQAVNGITPTNANGLELTYNLVGGAMGSYGAYYNTSGGAGAKTLGLTAPTSQQYSIVAAEVFGITPGTLASIAWFHI